MNEIVSITLITIRNSLYNEKARFALDCFLNDIEYQEKPYMPVLHQFSVRYHTHNRGGKADRVSSKYSTPLMIAYFKDGSKQLFHDSSSILEFIDLYNKTRHYFKFLRCHMKNMYSNHEIVQTEEFCSPIPPPNKLLFPNPKAKELEKHFSDFIGPHTRRILYFHLFSHKDCANKMIEIAHQNVSKKQAFTFALVYKFAQSYIEKSLRVTEEAMKKSLVYVRKECDKVEQILKQQKEKGQQFLASDSLSGADISFACMLSPVLGISWQDGFGANNDILKEVLPQSVLDEFRNREAGQYALHLFHHYRGKRKAATYPHIPEPISAVNDQIPSKL